MKKVILGIAVAAIAVAAFPASSSAKISSGTFYVCFDNGVPKRNYNGTTKIHLHKVKPSPRHYRRHHCHKVTLKLPSSPAKFITVPVPGPERIVYVNVPCPCQQPPPPPCSSRCEGDDNEDHGDKDHGHHDDHHGDKGKHGGDCKD